MSVANGAYTRSNGFMPEKDGIMPRFFIESVEDPLASQREGRPVFFDQERVELIIPGNMLNSPVEIVSNAHKDRWPEAYKRFKDGQEMSASGTPLEMWPILKPAQVRELKAINLYTVEHVAGMNDHVCQKMMGGQRLRELARAFLDDAAAMALVTKSTAEAEELRRRVTEQDAKIEELTRLLNSVHGQLVTLQNAPSAVAAHVPGQHDPMEAMRQHLATQPAGGQSSLDSLPAPAPRRRRQSAESQDSAA